jgi:tripartite-type tricarboxylate transporter receptor subunit TctC
MKRVAAALAVAAFAAITATTAVAQDYPTRPIKFILPYGAGNASDAIARAIAAKLEDRFKQPVVVENRPGANGVVGTVAAQAAPNDGYTILMVNGATQTATFVKSPQFDFFKAFDPVIPTVTGYYAVFINSEVPAKTLKEFIAYAKANPGKLNGAAGTGTTLLYLEMFKSLAGVDIVRVDYKSNPQAGLAVISNEAQVMIDTPFQYKQHVDSGKLRVLAAVGDKRMPGLPDVPTAKEAGLAGLDATPVSGIWVPAGTPAPIIAKLNAAVNDIFKTQDLIDLNNKLGTVKLGGTPADLRRLSMAEAAFSAKAAKLAKFEPK